MTGGDFFANTVNDEMDQQTIFAQQNAEGLQRALQAPQTDPTTIDMTLPRASVRAGKVLSFDANGNPSATEFIGSNRGNWASGTLYYVRDIIKDTSTSNIWQCVTQHTSTGSQPIGTNADAAKWFLLVDAAAAGASATAAAASASAAATSASNASTSATNAASSASTASTQASNASTSATNAASSATAAASSASTASTAATNAGNSATAAATSATNASNSASAASTSASNASTSATSAANSASTATTQATNASNSASAASTSASNASTSATNSANSATASASSATAAAASAAAAAASFDAFDDIYLGAKSSDPSVDNDGNALTTGDQYFNTSANELRVYNGSTWQAASTVGGTVTSLSVTGNTTLGDATADSVTVNAGTLNFAQTGQRITGDFSNATVANRATFQSSTTNGQTGIQAIPNGTSQQALFEANSDSSGGTNGSVGQFGVVAGSEIRVVSGQRGTGSYLPMTFYTGGSERMRVDTSGNVGIGTSSPTQKLAVNSANTSTNSLLEFKQGDVTQGYTGFGGDNILRLEASARPAGVVAGGTNFVFFTTNGSERARIDSSGNLLVARTDVVNQGRISVNMLGGTNVGLSVVNTNGGNTGNFCNFARSDTTVIGSIQQNGASAVTYSTSSDYRLKEDIAPMTGALATVAALNPVTYKWKVDGSDGQGFIAHELAEVCPQAVVGEKDAVDAEGNPVYQGIDTSFLVATLTAALQEAHGLIKDLQSRVDALEVK